MSESDTTGTNEPAEPAAESHQAGEAGVDLEALAARVYRLLKEEAWLERERLGRRQTW